MNRVPACLCFLASLFCGACAAAQEGFPQMPQPAKEHQWLERFLGEWTVDQQAEAGPGQAPVKAKGTIKSTKLGGFWVINEMKSEMPGMAVTGMQTLGYDRKQKKYVGTWVDSVTDTLWQYEGTLDEAGNVLTLEAEGPNLMADGKASKFRDIYEFKSEDEIVLYSKMLSDDGEWLTFMTGTAHRTK